ncbi:transmembrane protein C1orf162 homolog [Molossus molossus]|uniref:Uncharacterized protein n=1 Tax=Molossus molossus TaxID=27622 RepID=A0A7J8CPG5_MOLMO|nr:transmembrane protein C1orf162 homolog [Molossus molossus]KAF6412803.1 hypothetical protein HJG59_001779 [Molossus molossus]
MGGGSSKTEPSNEKQRPHITPAPTVSPTSCSNKELHLALAFLAGTLLTLLLMVLVVLIVKSYRKCHSSPQDLDPHSDPLAKLSSVPEDTLTYASMTFKLSEEKRDDLFANHPLDVNSVVYAQIKETNSP